MLFYLFSSYFCRLWYNEHTNTEIKSQKNSADENDISQDVSDETNEPPHEDTTDMLQEQQDEKETVVMQTDLEQEDTALSDELKEPTAKFLSSRKKKILKY